MPTRDPKLGPAPSPDQPSRTDWALAAPEQPHASAGQKMATRKPRDIEPEDVWRAQEFGSPTGSIGTRALTGRYGRWGSPWGNVPPALDAHLRSLVGYNRGKMYEMAEGGDAGKHHSALMRQAVDWGEQFTTAFGGPGTRKTSGDPFPYWERIGGGWPTGLVEARAARERGIELVEEAPGKWVWTGWEDDPEWKAYKEGVGHQRQLQAMQKVKESPDPFRTLFPAKDNPMMQLASAITGLEDQGPTYRPAATVVDPQDLDAGYLGRQSVSSAPSVKRSGYLDDEY